MIHFKMNINHLKLDYPANITVNCDPLTFQRQLPGLEIRTDKEYQ